MTEWGETAPKLVCGGWRLGTQERARRAFTLLAPQTIYSIVLRAPYSSNNNEVKFEASALKLTSSEREASVYMY